MTRVVSTGKETGNNFHPDNGTGAEVRTAMKDIFQALRTLNSASGDPTGAENVAAFQPHVNTATNELKICTSVSSGTGTFTTIGNITLPNLGLATLTGATFTGPIINNYTSAFRLPVGTTAQRPGSPAAGDIRFNSTTTEAEIFNGTIFTAVGGGAGATGGGNDEWVFENDRNVTQNYEITANKHAHSVSPTINSGVTITVPSGAILVIL
tara:strand:+ start:242 stop:871 length:630 start_codon:yes stop_codon:yes gene_type:complete